MILGTESLWSAFMCVTMRCCIARSFSSAGVDGSILIEAYSVSV